MVFHPCRHCCHPCRAGLDEHSMACSGMVRDPYWEEQSRQEEAQKRSRKSIAICQIAESIPGMYRAEVLGPRPVCPMWSSVNGDCSRFCGSWVFTTTALLFCQRGYPGYNNLGLSFFLVLHMVTCLNVALRCLANKCLHQILALRFPQKATWCCA